MGIINQRLYGRADSKCQYCGSESPLISQALGLCLDCGEMTTVPTAPLAEEELL